MSEQIPSVPQTQPLPSGSSLPTSPFQPNTTPQVQNSAGGFVWQVTPIQRLKRFLVLGSSNGTYYISAPALTLENAKNVIDLIQSGHGKEVVETVVEYSVSGRTAKQDNIIYALALAAKFGDADVKKMAYDAVDKVCRIPTTLFQFVGFTKSFADQTSSSATNDKKKSDNMQIDKAVKVEGKKPPPKKKSADNKGTNWGRGQRRAISKWYLSKTPQNLAYVATKYKNRNGYTHADLLRLCHIKPSSSTYSTLFKYLTHGWESVQASIEEDKGNDFVDVEGEKVWEFLGALEKLKNCTTADDGQVKFVLDSIKKYNLAREHLPSEMLNNADIWRTLLEKMPPTALMRNLPKMTVVGILSPLSPSLNKVVDTLTDAQTLHKARLHPFNILVASKVYGSGRGEKGKLTWTPIPEVSGALEKAYYASFKNVEPTNQRYLLGLDISGSMWGANVLGSESINAAVASGALSLTLIKTEKYVHTMAFCHEFVPVDISAADTLEVAMKKMQALSNRMGMTDCSLPMVYALKNKIPVDVFVVYTDNETYHGSVHPAVALQNYRREMNMPNAKLIVIAFASNSFTIADPNDPGMMDMCGFDSAGPEIMREFAMGNV